MSMINVLWNFHQETEIEENKQAIKGVKQDAVELGEKMYIPYFRELNRLSLICQAMWTLIEEETNLTERDLLGRVVELDLKDGKIDGQYKSPPVDCPNCKAKMSRKFNRCLFCGTENPEASTFNAL